MMRRSLLLAALVFTTPVVAHHKPDHCQGAGEGNPCNVPNPIPPATPDVPDPPIAGVPLPPDIPPTIPPAIDQLPPSNPIPPAIRELPTLGDVQDALYALMPTAYPVATGVMVEGSGNTRDAVDNAIDAAFDRVVAEDLGEGNYSFGRMGPNLTIWSQGFANWSEKETSDGNATGVFVGADSLVTDHLILGIVGGYDQSNTVLTSSDISSDSITVGAYSGVILNPWTLRLGGTYTFSDTHVDRTVQFGRFQDFATVDYNSGMGQIFGGVGYRFSTGPVVWNPYADLAYVFVNVDPFTEHGGPAALSVLSHNSATLISTLGLRAEYKFDHFKVKTRAAWRRSLTDLNTVDTVLFTGGGIGVNEAFDIPGSMMNKDIALFDLGVETPLWQGATFSLTYNGQFAKDEMRNGLTGLLRLKF